MIVVAAMLMTALLTYCLLWAIQTYTVTGYSMAPFFNHGERIFVLRGVPKRFYRRGDVVILKIYDISLPDTQIHGGNEVYIKRIIGLEGDLICDGIRVHGHIRSKAGKPWVVPARHCYVRSDSAGGMDSRLWGPIYLLYVNGLVLKRRPLI